MLLSPLKFLWFAAALIDLPLWVMNVVPVHGPDTLSVIFDRGLIEIYHDWCESLSTYPRSFDMLHASFLFGNLTQRCDVIDVAVEMDRVLRRGGFIIVHDTMEMTNKLSPILRSLHWSITQCYLYLLLLLLLILAVAAIFVKRSTTLTLAAVIWKDKPPDL